MGVIHKFTREGEQFTWEDVATKLYPGKAGSQVTKQELISARDGAGKFAVRYFEVAPKGHTSLDNHEHDHGVVVLRGRGIVLLKDKKYEIGFGDTIYIEPFETHQFENHSDEPFGFLCVIPPKRGVD